MVELCEMTSRDIVHAKYPAPAIEVMPEPLTQRDYELLKGGFRTYRDLLLCKLLRATGLRVSEVLGSRNRDGPRARGGLTPAHLREEPPDFCLLVRRAKKRGTGAAVFERVYLPPELGLELRDFIRGNRVPPDGRIFDVSDRQVENAFAAAGIKTLGRRVRPHELRGLYVKTLLEGGLPLEAASKMVGHADPRTTLRFYYRLTGEQQARIQRGIPV